MPIRWKALPIWNRMDEVQKLIDKLTPSLKAMAAQVEATRTEQPNIAGYMDQQLRTLIGALECALSNAERSVGTVRDNLPPAALAKERLAQQQDLGIDAGQAKKNTSDTYTPYPERMFNERVQELQNPPHQPVRGYQTALGAAPVAVAEPESAMTCSNCGKKVDIANLTEEDFLQNPYLGYMLDNGEWVCDDCGEKMGLDEE